MSKTKIKSFQDKCRVCLLKSIGMIDLFEPSNNIVDEIFFCSGIMFQREKDWPTQICTQCHNNLLIAHNFKSLCMETHKVLEELDLKCISVKLEPKIPTENRYADQNTPVYNKVDDYFLKSKPISMKGEEILDVVRDKELKHNVVKQKDFINKEFSCTLCGQSAVNKRLLKKHLRDFHPKADFVCEFCGKKLKYWSTMALHILSHKPPIYKCNDCTYETHNKHDLIRHMCVHMGIKKFNCKLCPKQFVTSSNLSQHIRRNHNRERNNPCTLCDKRFFDRTKLMRHLDTHNFVKRYHCSECESKFTRGEYLNQHLRRRHGIYPERQRPGKRKSAKIVI